MKWLYKLEYKYGRFGIRNLMKIVVAGMAAVYIVSLAGAAANFSLMSYLTLNRAAIFQGQVWRLITFVFLPPGDNLIWTVIGLYFYYMLGNYLESIWGSFRLTVYYLAGIIGSILAAMITGYGTNTYLNLSLFLAFATVAPDTQFLVFFIIPVKAKWMALVYAAFLALQIVFTFFSSFSIGLVSLVSLGFSLLNYVLFFGRGLIDMIQEQVRIARNRRNWRR